MNKHSENNSNIESEPKTTCFLFCLEYPHNNPNLVTTRKTSKSVLCVGDMKGETIQTFQLVLHILNNEWKNFIPETLGENVIQVDR